MVLLIDDDDATLYALSRRLSYRGYAPLAATDAAEGLQLLHERPTQSPPKAIVLDWKLPGISGLEALRTIRADRTFATVPVIVYTAYLDDGVGREAMAAGATECVTKGNPPGEDDLLMTLERYVAGRHADQG